MFSKKIKTKFMIFFMILAMSMAAPLGAQIMGDVDSNGTTDIVDSLLVAQYYVGLQPNPFDITVADVNCADSVDIVDALLIAQFYVRLINEFPCTLSTPTPTPTPTATPTPTPSPTQNTGRTAAQIVDQIKVGWNIGNTLEAICSENIWGNPNITQSLIFSIKSAGFNAIRLPVAWDCHSSNSTIDSGWMNRVKTVVDYCMNADMLVVMNIHWDNGWLENNVTTSAQNSVNEKQRAYWTQIANTFKNYDDRLLFASANEPNVDDSTQMSVLMRYHQTFVDTVRGTGGNNSTRVLVIQGPSTDIEKTNNLMNFMPQDTIADRMILEVHYYTPYQFCLMTEDASWGKMAYYWGNGYHSTIEPDRNATWGEEGDVEKLFGYMKSKFVDRGIPVIIGEFLAIKRSNPRDMSRHLDSRDYFHRYCVNSAKNKGIKIFLWDTGEVMDRNSGNIKDQRTVNALMEGAR